MPDCQEEKTKESVWNKINSSTLGQTIKTLLISLLIAFLVTRILQPTLVVGTSMVPTFHNGDYLLVDKLAYWNHSLPRKEDIVLLNSDLQQESVLIKRVMAVSGDHLQIKDGKVTVNGKTLDEPYINGSATIGSIDLVIPKDKIFVMGDNRGNSLDSRSSEVGLIDRKEIIGKIVLSLVPFRFNVNHLN